MPASFHRSQFEPGFYQAPSLHQINQHPIGSYQLHQEQRGSNDGEQKPVRPLPTPSSRNTRLTQNDLTRSTSPPVQIPNSNSETSGRKLRLSLKWDKTPVNLWLNLDHPPERFSQTLQDVCKRKDVKDWNSWVIWVKTGPLSPEDSAYCIALGQEDLHADWETTVQWLEENRRDKPPHLCGTFEFMEGR